MAILGQLLQQDGDGNILTGTRSDTTTVTIDEGTMLVHFTGTVTALSAPTTLPATTQAVLGTTVDVDYVIEIAVDEIEGGSVKFGFKLTEDEQTLVQLDYNMGGQTDREESSVKIGTLDLTDSSYTFKGVGFVEYTDDERFTYAFDISSESSFDFSYREAWFSNGTPGMTFRHCIIGGGNKDVEFALKYRLFTPADTTEAFTDYSLDQVFGPGYTEGAGLISAYSEYLGDELLFGYSTLPQAMISDPWD